MGPHPGVAWIRETRPQMAKTTQGASSPATLSCRGRTRVNLTDSKLQSPGLNHVFTYCRPRSAASCAAAFG